MKRCARCRRLQPDDELARTNTISELYVCRNVTDCERAERCEICQRRFIHAYPVDTQMKRKPITEAKLDALANDGTLSRIAMRLAIDAGNDWPSLNGDERDEWCERAIEKLRSGEISPNGY